MPYEYLEDIATADIAFRAWDRTLEKTFVAAGEATLNVMVENPEAIRPRHKRQIRLENDALDMLLFDFLQEFIYYKDAEYLLLRAPAVCIKQNEGRYILSAEAEGEALDSERHEMRVDVKAVTLHRFSLQKTGQGWEATVILDI